MPAALAPPPLDLILASGSLTRARLLENRGLQPRCEPSGVDEDALKARLLSLGHGPRAVAERLAEEKALAVSRRKPSALVLGADQTLSLGSELLSKQDDRTSLAAALRRLAGRTHELHSAFAFATGGRTLEVGRVTARLRMHALVPEEIESYLDQAGPDVLGSVGGYHIESSGRRLFASVEGETDTIMGLPMAAVLDFMQRRRSRERAAPAC